MPTPRAGAYRRRQTTRLRRIYTTARAYARSMSPSVDGMLPDIVIIGSQRGGTTSLFRHLSGHPQIVTARSKELNALSLHFDKGEGWHRGHFPAPAADRQALEASPLYLVDPRVPQRAAARLPTAQFVALLRNPVDRAYSHYLHNLAHGVEDLSFADALAAEPARLAEARRCGLDSRRGIELFRSSSYVLRGQYTPQVERWQQHVPPSRLTVLRSEDFFADPQMVVDQLLHRFALAPFADLTSRPVNHWDDDAQTQLTPTVRLRLEREFADSTASLASLVGWSETWSDLSA